MNTTYSDNYDLSWFSRKMDLRNNENTPTVDTVRIK